MIYRRMADGIPRETAADDIAFDRHYDVIVAGTGTAGSFAVLAAAMQGVSVLGVDRFSGAGGMSTFGYVDGYYYGANGGMYEKIDREGKALQDEMFLGKVEAKQYLLEKKAADQGAEFLFETVVTGVYLNGKTVRGISVLTEDGVQNLACEMLIDATAEAEVCVMAGCAADCGRQSDGKTRPYTSVKVWVTEEGNIARTNHDSGYINQYDPKELSNAILAAHESQLLGEFRNKHGRVLFLAPSIGIREGRRILAEETVTMQKILDGDQTKTPLFYAYSDFDKHGKDNALETELLQDWYVASNLSTVCLSVPISIKSLIPKGYRSLLTAGRHIGVDHDTASLVRMKKDMFKCGESAGVCAALAVKKGVQPIDLPYKEVREILQETGCLQEENNVGIMFDDQYRRMQVRWLTDENEIRRELAGDMPGIAIYSCKRLGNRMAEELKQWMSGADGNELLRSNCAIALGLIGDKACLPVLRDIVRNRDSFYYKDNRRTNQLRTVIAIYLAGKLGDMELAPMLKEILLDEREYGKGLYHEITKTSYLFNPNRNFNEVYFQVISYAAVSLIRIMEKHPENQEFRKEGLKILKEAFGDDFHIQKTTSMPEGTFEYASMQNIRDYVNRYCRKKL